MRVRRIAPGWELHENHPAEVDALEGERDRNKRRGVGERVGKAHVSHRVVGEFEQRQPSPTPCLLRRNDSAVVSPTRVC